MRVARLFRNLMLGSHYIPSRAEFKRVMLTGYLSLLCVVANLMYIIVDSYSGNDALTWLNMIFFGVSTTAVVLLRVKRYTASKLALFLGAYALVFLFCIIEPAATGVPFFLILISLGAIALFGMEQWRYGIALCVIGAILFLISGVFEYKLVEMEFTERYIRNNYITNFYVILIIAILIIYFMIDLHHYSEKSLEEKESEAQLKNKELTKLNSELDRFVYSVSHDLRSPLTTITGLVNIGKHATTLEEANQYFTMIGERVQTQEYFIREIIDFYRNSRTTLSIEPLPLKKIVNEVVTEHKIADDGIEFAVDVPDNVVVHSDKIRLKSVLSNLIGNAIKYHDDTKRQRFVNVSVEDQAGYWLIAVQDNGLGIGAEHLPKIFDMFYRASADSKGSGLGLFIARETVEKLGGKIQLSSTLGAGSRFWFTIAMPTLQN